MKASGIITTTTDFGHRGPFTAIMKGVILSRFPEARVVDLIHDIPAQWPPEAGFWISKAYRYFPKGTLHVAIVDPGVGTERSILMAECDDHLFIAPDNGLLSRLLEEHDATLYHLDERALQTLGLGTPSSTFHGRDIFAPVAAEIAAGRLRFSDLGTPTSEWIPDWIDPPDCQRARVSGSIVTIDTFGNLISNVEASMIATIRAPRVRFAGLELSMIETYGRATPGDYLALVNSFEVVEIARAEGNAADGLGVGRGAPVTIIEG
ncbi:MAG: SAM-dependent chlorinase/fluorinase [Pseudomonadota bacterium]